MTYMYLHVGRHFFLLLVTFSPSFSQPVFEPSCIKCCRNSLFYNNQLFFFSVIFTAWLWTYFLFSVSPWYNIIFLCLAFSLCILQQSEISIFRHFYDLSSKVLPFLWQPMVLHDFFISLMFFPYILRQYNVGMLFVCVLLPAILLTNSRSFPLQTKQRESYKRLNAQKKSSISQRCKISVCQIVLVSFSKKSREKRFQCIRPENILQMHGKMNTI